MEVIVLCSFSFCTIETNGKVTHSTRNENIGQSNFIEQVSTIKNECKMHFLVDGLDNIIDMNHVDKENILLLKRFYRSPEFIRLVRMSRKN